MPDPYAACTSATCPASDSIYGYAPSAVASLLFAAIFAICSLAYIFQCVRTRSWSFLVSMLLGSLAECIGYIGRYQLSKDAFDPNGFKVQIICLTFAPAFLGAGIYLTLKHLIIVMDPTISRIQPRIYTWLFIGFDIVSILTQVAGASIAAIGSNLSLGNNLMIAGLAFQVGTMSLFGLLAGEYLVAVLRHRGTLNERTAALRQTIQFKGFIAAFIIAYFTILIRCCYRVAEMSGGWRNPIMQDQAVFIALDSVMCSLMVISFVVFSPTVIFKISKEHAKLGASSFELQDSSMDEERKINHPTATQY